MRYVERQGWILDRAAGRRVLHLGFVGDTEASAAKRVEEFRQSLHARLISRCSELVGVDSSAMVVEELTAQGIPNLVVADVERLDNVLNAHAFDMVLVGDLIEHLSNPGLMLDGLRDYLRPGGEIIVSTPNAFGLPAYLRFVARRFREGGDHVSSYNLFTLSNLLNRHGWTVAETYTCYQEKSKYGLLFRLGAAALSLSPRFGGTLLVVGRLA